MAETFQLLKQEIMQAIEAEHDFAKWKLIVVAALGAAALGLGKDGKSQSPHYEHWLLPIIPFACAYIDLQTYQCLNRIMVIARFIRTYRKDDPTMGNGDRAMQRYEDFCAQARGTQAFFSLGSRANFAASLIASVVAAGAFFWLVCDFWPLGGLVTSFTIGIWVLGVVLICILGYYHKYRSLPSIEQLKPKADN